MALGLFLIGEDTIEAVRQIRIDAIAAINSGTVISWSSEGTSVQKVLDSKFSLKEIIEECNYFLRQVDPKVRKNNPFRHRTSPFIL